MRADKTDSLSDPNSWALREFQQADLGDTRLNRRLGEIASDFAEHPGAAIPQACGTQKRTKAAYRFFENDLVDPQAIRQAHHQMTLQRSLEHELILAIQDTCIFNYSHHFQTAGLGSIDRSYYARGFLLHSALATTPQGEPLGLLDALVWRRDLAKRGSTKKRWRLPVEKKESYKWIRTLKHCRELCEKHTRTIVVHVADQEADIYELFTQASKSRQMGWKVHLLIRSRHNRRLYKQEELLWEQVGQKPAAGILQVKVGRKGELPARTATLEVRFAEVVLKSPNGKAALGPERIWGIEAKEVNPPKGVEPILWHLLSSLPVESLEAAIEKVRWYSLRWQVEVFHKAIKSGCKVEERQLETFKRLERSLSVDLVVAWRILALTKAAREEPEAPASKWLSEAEWKALVCHEKQERQAPKEPPKLREAVRFIAKLGGFIGRKSDGEPGILCLSRGLHRLQDITRMWRLYNQMEHELPEDVGNG
jgi:hypothetical protein